MPLSVIILSYGKITSQVMTHEAKLKEQVRFLYPLLIKVTVYINIYFMKTIDATRTG